MAQVTIRGLLLTQLESELDLPAGARMQDDVGPSLLKWEDGRKAEADAGKLKRALSASAGVAIDLLNSASDEDAAGVFGAPRGTQDEAGIVPLPRLAPGQGYWLKYRLSAGLRVEASKDLGLATIAGDVGRDIEYASYRRHPGDRRIADAIVADLGAMPSALDVDDVLALPNGDAVLIQVPGKLSLTLTFDESLLASTSLRPVLSEFGIAGPVVLEVKSGFSFSASLELTDDLRLCYAGLGGGNTHVSLRKADVSKATAALGAAVSVGFDQATQDRLNDLISSQLIGATVAKVSDLLSTLDPAALIPADQPLLNLLAERFGLTGSAAQKLKALKEKLQGWETRISKSVKTALSTRIALGFSYEYSRIATSGSLFEAEMASATLRGLHASLLNFDCRPALEMARQEAGMDEANRRLKGFFYLHERRVVRTAARGITLGIGKWFQFSAKLSGTRTSIEQTNADRHKRYAWISVNQMTSALNKREAGSSLTFRAESQHFAAAPAMGDLLYALSLEARQDQVTRDQLPGLVDAAALWGVIDRTRIDELISKLRTRIPADVRPDARISLTASDAIVRRFAEYLRAHSNRDLAPILARALPYWPKHPGRTMLAERERIYTPVFEEFVDLAGGINYKPELRVRALLSATHPSLAAAEARASRPKQLAFVGYATEEDGVGHNAIGMRINSCRRAFGDLLDTPMAPATKMQQILDDLYASHSTFVERSFTVRFFGALLADVASKSGRPDDWNAILTFTWLQDGEEMTAVWQS